MSPDAATRWARREDLSLLTDFYELTMMNGYWRTERQSITACFEYFFRSLPPHGGFAVFAGVEQLADYLENFRFTWDDLEYLESLEVFADDFLEYLADFRLQGTIHAAEEGSLVFPHEPLLRVEGPLSEVQFLETFILNALNYPTLVATKTARICQAANGDPVVEFGLRRAQGPDGGLSGARASFIGGASGTSNVLAGRLFGIPVRGTHAHSWVMSFPDELTAFRAYAQPYPQSCLLLVDTYDTLLSGLPNALTVFEELRKKHPQTRAAVRLDSGDLARLSKAAYRIFTEAGFEDPLIMASSELDEDLIADMKRQQAKINAWGVGTHLITSSNWPALGGVYKLVAMHDEQGDWQPRIKTSSTPEKTTDPGRKRVVRYRDEEGRPLGDLLYMSDEEPVTEGLIPYAPRTEVSFIRGLEGAATAESLLQPILVEGVRVHEHKPLALIRERAQREISLLPDEYRRLRNPERYTVGLSPKLARVKAELIRRSPGVLE
ncbi:MAG TPA: nicotinate phosphoribosyltransferase [Thermoleophilia bacterium]|nr:nicotinate phosphoribosyltransferase [Thermoleophilia bacterium]